jgi:LacI family gluconate utilization system Gnt-I transcriptional repressor
VATPRYAIGAAAANMLLTLMAGEQPAQPQQDLGFQLLLRGST